MKKKLSRVSLFSAIALSIIIVAYNIIFFVLFNLPQVKHTSDTVIWISYGVTMFICLFLIVYSFLGLMSKEVKNRFLSLPVISTSLTTLLLQIIADIIFFVVSFFASIPIYVGVIVEVILVAVFAISVVARVALKKQVNDTTEELKEKSKWIDEFRIQLNFLLNTCKDESLKNKLNAIVEDAKYSSPVSNENVVEVENKIDNVLASLKVHLNDQNFTECNNDVDSLDSLLKERKERAVIK